MNETIYEVLGFESATFTSKDENAAEREPVECVRICLATPAKEGKGKLGETHWVSQSRLERWGYSPKVGDQVLAAFMWKDRKRKLGFLQALPSVK